VLTKAVVRRLFDYNPVTGSLTWRISPANRVKVGDEAGTVSCGYRRVRIKNKPYLAHIIIWIWMKGRLPKRKIDHRDGNGSNNKWSNLRMATSTENQRNTKLRKDNSSGVKGVSFHKRYGKWAAYITINKKTITIGFFDSVEAAAEARRNAALKHFGEFAREVA